MKSFSLVGMVIVLAGTALVTLYMLLVGMAFSSEPGGQGGGDIGGALMMALPLIATIGFGIVAIIKHVRGQQGLAWGLALTPIGLLFLFLSLFAF